MANLCDPHLVPGISKGVRRDVLLGRLKLNLINGPIGNLKWYRLFQGTVETCFRPTRDSVIPSAEWTRCSAVNETIFASRQRQHGTDRCRQHGTDTRVVATVAAGAARRMVIRIASLYIYTVAVDYLPHQWMNKVVHLSST